MVNIRFKNISQPMYLPKQRRQVRTETEMFGRRGLADGSGHGHCSTNSLSSSSPMYSPTSFLVAIRKKKRTSSWLTAVPLRWLWTRSSLAVKTPSLCGGLSQSEEENALPSQAWMKARRPSSSVSCFQSRLGLSLGSELASGLSLELGSWLGLGLGFGERESHG